MFLILLGVYAAVGHAEGGPRSKPFSFSTFQKFMNNEKGNGRLNLPLLPATNSRLDMLQFLPKIR